MVLLLKFWPYIAGFLLVVGIVYGIYNYGVQHERAIWQAEIAKMNLEHEQALQVATEKVKAAEEKGAQDVAELDKHYTEVMNANKKQADADIAALNAGTIKLRSRFSCPAANSPAGTVTTPSSVGNGATQGGLQRSDAEFLIRLSDEADGVTTQLAAAQLLITDYRHIIADFAQKIAQN